MMAVWSLVREAAYKLGLMSLYHLIRNRRTLTVFMFHRVLPAEAPEYAVAEREFTLSVDSFGRCLDFIKKHYNVIPHSAVHEQVASGKPLPSRAGLITFDDGWRDTLTYALPELRKRDLPALLFLATEVLDLAECRWWQDMVVEALSAPGGLGSIEEALHLSTEPSTSRAERVRRATSVFAEMGDARRHAILSAFVKPAPVTRQMLSVSDLENLKPDVAIAGHGHTHAPLSFHSNPREECERARAKLMEIGGDDWALSFPHGAYDKKVLDQARAAGFLVCYSSEAELVDTSAKGRNMKHPLGRIHLPENEWTCGRTGISEAKLSSFLFLRPVAK